MVRLHVKKGDDSQFLCDTDVEANVDDVISDIVVIYNGRLKISRICYEIEELAKHGVMLPPDIMGLTDDQVEELKLKDEWADKCVPMGGWTFNKDKIGHRNGRQPNEKMQEVLKKTIEDARTMTSKKLVQQEKLVTQKTVQEALDLLRGAVTIVYPMGLPPHDVIRKEFENTEDLTGTQASLERSRTLYRLCVDRIVRSTTSSKHAEDDDDDDDDDDDNDNDDGDDGDDVA
ncbi:Uncharacterized protein C21orf59 [Trachymyrmex cornetzi]|uniref:Uncharacterized protein C21orf59 n=1 Tax=Trachymyrmex cornetzi TaxID=471704 RepID=A0A195EJL1_9HYME|nr:Uncharacterized protein C21orf59 [Trachymyrmex cornetzi]